MNARKIMGIVASIACAALAPVACSSSEDANHPASTYASATQSLEGDGTIPRVPNPPLASDLANLPGDLRAVSVPTPPKIGDYVVNSGAAIALGKALFWDMQVGSDGVQACASCHFRAGADPRSKNQLSPGLKRVPVPDLAFTVGGPNYQLSIATFPLTRLAVPGVRGALDPATDIGDVVSSQGVPFLGTGADPLGFQIGATKTRRVEPRNTPSVINAVFNHRQFWDGRAEEVFNGVNPFGMRDPNAKVVRANTKTSLVQVRVELTRSSLASQAVAPIVSELEMSVPGQTAAEILRTAARAVRAKGRVLSSVRPLGKQFVAPTDSVLGGLSRAPVNGLKTSNYEKMIQDAFQPVWWDATKFVRVDVDGNVSFVSGLGNGPPGSETYRLVEYNFALFFGIAVQMYEATLVSDDTPWDRFRRAHPGSTDPALNPWTNTAPDNISRLALFGAHLFNDRTRGATNIRCSNCHEQAELTDASVRRITSAVNGPVRNRDGNVIDKGFNNVGIRPTSDDLGAGATDALGPLSFTRRMFPSAPPATFDGAAVTKGFGVEGAFKIPSLRNVALTPPYFHNGDVRTLREAVELYRRGGNVAPITTTDGTLIEPLGVPALSNDEIDAIVAWLEALTDERVVYQRAPFDHPQLFVPNGHVGTHTAVTDANGDGLADDVLYEIPAVGASGGSPIPGFLEGPFAPSPVP